MAHVMLIDYARVSTDDQNLNLQRDALQKSACTQRCEDHMNNSKSEACLRSRNSNEKS
jgi:DNA invertase Pin-like site-specific DNA recombinase